MSIICLKMMLATAACIIGGAAIGTICGFALHCLKEVIKNAR